MPRSARFYPCSVGPPAATAAVRVAVRRCLAELPAPAGQPLALVACSGGADSLALACATAFVAPRLGWRAGLVTVDHGLQPASDEVAASVVATGRRLGLAPVEAVRVEVGSSGGPEAAARAARRQALTNAAARHHAVAVLLAHTRDDQAETVLLGLARGSGLRSLAGMRPVTSDEEGLLWVRPLLDLPRATVRAAATEAAEASQLTVWEDPSNADERFRRSRVRHRILPALEAELGPGVAAALARTAALAGEDADALEELARTAFEKVAVVADGVVTLDVHGLAALPVAVRTRVLRTAALAAGSAPSDLARAHVLEVDRLVAGWRGQGPLELPGPVSVVRRSGRIAMQAQPRDESR